MFAFDGKRIDKQKRVDDFLKNIVLVLAETTGDNETQLSPAHNSASSKWIKFIVG